MSRDFILVFSGGMVALVTTLVVLFIVDYFYRYERERPSRTSSATPPLPASPLAAVTQTPALQAALSPQSSVQPTPQPGAPSNTDPPGVPVAASQAATLPSLEQPLESPKGSAIVATSITEQPTGSAAAAPPPPETIIKNRT